MSQHIGGQYCIRPPRSIFPYGMIAASTLCSACLHFYYLYTDMINHNSHIFVFLLHRIAWISYMVAKDVLWRKKPQSPLQ